MYTQIPQKLPRPAVRGIASGVIFMAFFGAFWGIASASFMNGAIQILAFILIALVTLALFIVAVKILRYARSLPATLSPEETAIGKGISMWFGIIFGLEILLIVLASILLSRFQLSRFITPTIALIVGLHFLPLAHLFHVPAYYITGTLLSVLALIALVALLLGLPIAGPSPYNWSLFVGIGAALIIWLTGTYVARSGLLVMRQSA